MNFKNLLMWIVIVFLVLGLFNLFQNPKSTHVQNKISFSNFMEEVDNGRVVQVEIQGNNIKGTCLLYTSPRPRDQRGSRMPSSA